MIRLIKKIGRPVLLSAILILCTGVVFAQLQFVENKGQWDKKIVFKGDLNFGSFILKQDGGFKIVLYHPDDLLAITSRFHGGLNKPADNNKKTTTLAAGKDTVIKSLRGHAYEVSFVNANPHPQVLTDKPLSAYSNYIIGSDSSKWRNGCKIYRGITFKNIYQNIDVRYYTSNGQLKYDIIVHPGGDLGNVVMYYDGVKDLTLKNGTLIIKTSVGEVKELFPISFQPGEKGRAEIASAYRLEGNYVSFKLNEPYDPKKTLVIDPTLVFSSFSGSKSDNWGYTATYDAQGNFYAGGIVFGSGYPVTNGAFQSNFAGGNNGTGEGGQGVDMNGFDIGIMKFNSTGSTVLYATYIGGSAGNEQPHSLVVDGSGNLIIAGRTTSSDYPMKNPLTGSTKNLYGPGGGQDIILTKLNSTGGMIGSMRIGGSKDDGVNIRTKDISPYGTESIRRNYGDDARSEVVLDAAGNVYLVSCTQSPTDFPVVNGFQTASNGNTSYHQNAVVIKAAPDLSSIIFSTYLGGSGNDAAFALALNPVNNNIYLAGATTSTNFPGASNSFNGGICDGFISIISNGATPALVTSKYFGTASADQLYGIQFNKSGSNVFVSGTTEGVMPVVNSPFNTSYGQAKGNQFIIKLSADLSTVVYSANYGNGGTSPNISPAAFLVDICENVYVSGWGGGLDGNYSNQGTSGMTAKAAPDGTQPLSATTDGNGFYFFVLEKNAASQLYGGFFGDRKMQVDQNGNVFGPAGDFNGVHVDGGTSRFDNNGVVYQSICACGPDPNMTTPNVAYPNNAAYQSSSGYACNLLALKVAFNLTGVTASIQPTVNGAYDTVGCVPMTLSFTDTIGKGKTFVWNFGDGTPQTTTTTPTVSHTYNSIGRFTIMLVAIDSSSCNIADTAYVSIKVGKNIVTPSFVPQKIGGCNSNTFQFTNTSTAVDPIYNSNSFLWNFGDGSPLVSAGINSVNYTYQSAGKYNVSLIAVDTSFCNAPDTVSQLIQLVANVKAAFTVHQTGCVPYNAVFTNTSTGGTSFAWNFGDGQTSTMPNPTHLYQDTGTYTIQLIANDPSTCNLTDTSYSTVTVYGIPTSLFTYSPNPSQENTPTQFTNESQNATGYQWLFGDGDTSMEVNTSHQYTMTDTFKVCLVATNIIGCTDTSCQLVAAVVKPLLDVPNAFTPGKFGTNSVIKVMGFGISKMDWRIYNRWGQLVFESNSKDIGWDGTYKGVLQPMDVYTYTLDVQFFNGVNYRKTGDITLLR